MIQIKKFSLLVWFVTVLAILILSAFFIGCKSFKPVTIEGEPERSDYYTTLKFYAQSGAKDAALAGVVYTAVQQADARKRADAETDKKLNLLLKCKEIYFGPEPVNKKDYDKYLLYTECIGK